MPKSEHLDSAAPRLFDDVVLSLYLNEDHKIVCADHGDGIPLTKHDQDEAFALGMKRPFECTRCQL